MDQDPSLTIIHFTFSSALLHSNIVPFIMREIAVLIFIIYWGINELSGNMINRLLLCSAGSKEEMIEFSNFLNFKFWYLKFFKEFWVTLSFWILCIRDTKDTYKHKQTKETNCQAQSQKPNLKATIPRIWTLVNNKMMRTTNPNHHPPLNKNFQTIKLKVNCLKYSILSIFHF